MAVDAIETMQLGPSALLDEADGEPQVEPQVERRLSWSRHSSVDRRSFDEISADKTKVSPASASAATTESNKGARRRRSFEQLLALSADGGTNGLLKDAVCSAWGVNEELTPKQKMDMLLIRSKKKGLDANKLFQYFDVNKDTFITSAEVRKEFEAYCFALPDASWKAERLRREAKEMETGPEVATPKVSGSENKVVAPVAPTTPATIASTASDRRSSTSKTPTFRPSAEYDKDVAGKMTKSASLKIFEGRRRKSAIERAGANVVGQKKSAFK